ncbi:phage tail protein [Nocardia sp. NPDC051052]|uniref:Gp37-like protein n=1 Tax=Nocardia sp. NPDC051052 TaxID=3364322 RepID=UPI0037B958D0
MSASTVSPPAPAEAVARSDAIYDTTMTTRKRRKDSRRSRPLVRLWDGNWALRGIVAAEYDASFGWMLNETGVARVTLPADHYLARWVMDAQKRTTQNVHITADHLGARWGGRLRKATLKKSESGLMTVVLTFAHDVEELKFLTAWSNPLLPDFVQFPKYFTLVGPSAWTLKLTLFLNLLRLQFSDFVLSDDPLNPATWFDWDQSQWPIVVAPGTLLSDTSLWCIINSRWTNFFDLAKPILDDAELMVVCRRWLEGDPLPWPGARLRNGALVVDIVDRSGWYSGATSAGGTMWDGLRRTVFQMATDLVEGVLVDATDATDASEYLLENWMGTKPEHPWVVYREDDITGIQSSEFTIVPATATRIGVGGKSAPGVNEGIGMAIQAAGDALAAVPFMVPVGGILDTLLKPVYENALLAWISINNPLRAKALGWSHYREHFQRGADRAYTLSSLIALRAGYYATRGFHSHKLTIADGSPYYIGENGRGHFFLGDRIGASIAGGPPGKVFVDRVTELELSWKRGQAPAWAITVGQDADTDPFAKVLQHIQTIMGDLHAIGVI